MAASQEYVNIYSTRRVVTYVPRVEPSPVYDIAITNIVWCTAYKRRGRWGGVYCAMVVQYYCNGVGFVSVGGGNKRRMDSQIKL